MPKHIWVSVSDLEHAAITAECERDGVSASNIFRKAKGLPPLERHRFTRAEQIAGCVASPATKGAVPAGGKRVSAKAENDLDYLIRH